MNLIEVLTIITLIVCIISLVIDIISEYKSRKWDNRIEKLLKNRENRALALDEE